MHETKIIGSKEIEDKKYGYNVEIYQLEEGKEAKQTTEKVVLTNKGGINKAIGIKIKTQGVFYFSGLSEFEIRICQEGTSEEIYQLYEIDTWEEFRIENRRYIKDVYAKKEYEEEKYGAWLTGVNVLSQVLCILILAFGYSLDYIGSGGSTSITFLWACILFLSCFFYDGIMQVRYVKLVQKVHPEKKGDPSSSKFQKEWLASCDEAEKEIVFQSAYKAYMCMNKVIPLLLLLTLILNLFFNTGILAIIVVAGMYLVMTVAYSKACVQIRKEKIFR